MSVLGALRRPGRTGANRCWLCTVVNVLVVALLAAVLGRRRRGLGLGVAAVGALLVSLRGYVVPYIPAFAPKLVAASPLPDGVFHTEPPTPGIERTETEAGDNGLGDPGDADGEQLLETLVEAGALTVDGDAIDLDPAFADA